MPAAVEKRSVRAQLISFNEKAELSTATISIDKGRRNNVDAGVKAN
jgi:hypothetical protein